MFSGAFKEILDELADKNDKGKEDRLPSKLFKWFKIVTYTLTTIILVGLPLQLLLQIKSWIFN